MRTIGGAALALALAMMGCQPASPVLSGSGPVQRVRLPGTGRQLLIGGSESEGACWFQAEAGHATPLPAPPVSLFPVAFSPSPDGRYLAVISVGEGHPILDILDVSRLLAGTHGEKALRTIDPYPGSISLNGWKGGRLRVLSDRPLLACCDGSGRVPGGDVSEAPESYGIDVATGAVTRE